MKRRIYIAGRIAVVLLLVYSSVFAQRTITGKVTDGTAPLPGVSVQVMGTSLGTQTDLDGNYSLSVPDDAVLRFSLLGFESQEIPADNREVINVTLVPGTEVLEEVVVTALGVERELKALGSSVTQVDGSALTEAREINLGDALQGRVAGLNVSNIGSGAGGSSRVIIRGNSSLNSNNQPLFVIDGVPIDNTQLGGADMWGGSDFGDGLNSINPDDIESVSVLKGGSAAALYGSRASNGVIMITTKQGTKRKGIGIELNSNFTVEQILNPYDFQTEYGHGNRGNKPGTVSEALEWGGSAWGARLDGSDVIQFDGTERPYVYAGDNFSKYYRTGSTITNTLALSGGSDRQTFRFSASDLRNQAVTPNSGMNRQNFSLNTHANWVERLTLEAKLQYSREDVKNRPRLSDAPGNGNYTLSVLPPSIDVEDMKGTTGKLGANEEGTELQYTSNTFSQNPYWAAYQFSTKDVRDRFMGSGVVRFDFTDWLYVQGRMGMDWYTSRRTTIEPYGTAYKTLGGMQEQERRVRELNMEFMLGGGKTFGDFGINAFVGGNRMRNQFELIGAGGDDFNIAFFHTVSNLKSPTVTYEFSDKGINSLFGSAEFSYKSFLYLTATGRNDWFSTLNPETNSIFYPSLSGSFVFSEAFEMPQWIDFGKLRGSWSRVGGDTEPYQTALDYSLVGSGHQDQALGRITQDRIPNEFLTPLSLDEFEVGMDVRFLNGRLGIDYAYYNRKTKDDILFAPVSEASGYAEAVVNVGEVRNSGHELLLTGRPVDSRLKWDVSLNFAYNNNEVLRLVGDSKSLQADEARSRQAFIHHRLPYTDESLGEFFPGGYGMIVGRKHKTINGQKVYDENGYPVVADFVSVLGPGVHPYTGGVNNSFSWNNFNLSFLVDYKFGGYLYSGTNVTTYGNGMHKATLEGRENGLEISGVDEEGNAGTWTIAPENLQDYYGRYNDIVEYFVYDADFIKLRSLTLGYTFPADKLANTPVSGLSISLVGRNLWLIHSKVDNVDPESTYNNTNAQGLEWFGVPSARSFGLNLNITF